MTTSSAASRMLHPPPTWVSRLMALDKLLAPLDPEVAGRFQQMMARRGIVLHLGARLEEVAEADGRVRVRFSGGELEAEQVLVATGRRPNTTDLGLEQAGVAMSRGAIAVEHQLRTNVDGVYAIGDATGVSMLAHTASYLGEIAVANALGEG